MKERWREEREMEDNEKHIEKRELSEHQEIRDWGAAKEGIHGGIYRKRAGNDARLQERSLSSARLAGFKRCNHTVHSDSLLATAFLICATLLRKLNINLFYYLGWMGLGTAWRVYLWHDYPRGEVCPTRGGSPRATPRPKFGGARFEPGWGQCLGHQIQRVSLN